MKKIFWAGGLICILCWIAFVATEPTGPIVTDRGGEKHEIASISDLPKRDYSLSSQRTGCASSSSEQIIQAKIRQASLPKGKYANLIEAFEKPGELLAAARRGDASAAIILFKGITACYPIYMDELKLEKFMLTEQCQNIGKDLYRNRFTLLEGLAEDGDLAAQTVYAVQVTAAANIQARSKDPSEVAQARKLIRQAQEYADISAKKGSKESVVFLAGAYHDGLFGVPDKARAYAYLLALSHDFPTEVPQSVLKAAEANLTESELESAKQKIYRCDQEAERSSLVSPFG